MFIKRELNTMQRLFLIFIFITINLFAQIDTTDYYPLHVGDKWQYYELFTHSSYTIEVIGDTIMPNGQPYFILTSLDRKFQRVENNRYVYFFNEDTQNSETILFDVFSPKGTLFWAPLNPFPNCYSGMGIYDVGVDSDNLFGENLEWRDIRLATVYTNVTPPDTIWDRTVDAYWPRITKGIGVTAFSYGMEELIGAVINKVGYGILSGVKEPINSIPSDFELFQNYPNPFNPSTIITFEIPKDNFVELSVYDILGREVEKLVSEFKQAGRYTVDFNGNNLSSGLYIYKLKAGDYSATKKMMLLK